MMHARKALGTRIKALNLSISDQNLDLLPDYQQRIAVLKTLRFVDPVSEAVLLKGRVACEINSADELLLTELILDNFFNALTPQESVALLSVFIFQEKTDMQPELLPRLAEVRRQIRAPSSDADSSFARATPPSSPRQSESVPCRRLII